MPVCPTGRPLIKVRCSPAARVGAANAILDRAHGRPPQAIALSGAGDNYDLDRLTDEQLLLLEELLTIALVTVRNFGEYHETARISTTLADRARQLG
jgi:hypothetical protein